MNSYIALALVLCIAVAQVQSQGAQPTTAGAAGAGARAGLMGRGSMLPLMAASSGNDMMQNLFLMRMLTQNRRPGGAMGGLEPLLMSNMLGLELFGM